MVFNGERGKSSGRMRAGLLNRGWAMPFFPGCEWVRAGAAGAAAAVLPIPALRAAEPIKLGALLPFSGGLELFGNQAKLGLDLALNEINDAGGILGRPVELIFEDKIGRAHV